MTMWWAGPTVTNLLAALGADVLKVESCRRCDPNRLLHQGPPKDGADVKWWELSPLFAQGNNNKRDVAIELDTPAGMAALERLIASADLLVENFSPRVLDNFGLTPERLLELNPELVAVRMPAFGLDGPLRNSTGFAATMEAMSGIAVRTGFAEDAPVPPMGVCDPLAGVHATVATLIGLFESRRAGHGNVVEATMVEAALNVTVEALLHYDATGEVLGRIGNRDLVMAPQGIYQCVGDDVWVAVTVDDDRCWQALCRVAGWVDWEHDPDFATNAGRRERHDLIDDELTRWFADKDAETAVELLVSHGVPAAEAVIPRDAYFNPQLRHRGFHPTIHRPVSGDKVITYEVPFRMDGVADWIRSPTPTLGQHNAEILREVGYTDAEIAELAASKVIGEELVQ
jgi:crotonobetainyl-CoA:carnitine CoA-transferase CaiB-like acyl-CoA transferase